MTGKKRDEVGADAGDVQTTPQTMLEGGTADEQAEENKDAAASDNESSDAKETKQQEDSAPVEESTGDDTAKASTQQGCKNYFAVVYQK